MDLKISCPQCHQPLEPVERYCVNCGVHLAFTVALTEYELANLTAIPPGSPIVPEVLVPKLGKYLLEKGVLEPAGIEQALALQKKRRETGQTILIGQALVELNLIDRATLDEAVTEQIISLHNALQQTNQKLEQRVQERTVELQNALHKLTELNQLKTNFISNISHELRTPLTHLKGYLDLLLDGSLGTLDQQQSDALRVLQKAEKRLETLIEDLIQFSFAARGELSLKIKSVDLRGLISKITEEYMQIASSNEITLKTIFSDDLPTVLADEVKITWVISQLVDNAIKFTSRGGLIEVGAHSEDGFVVVSVKDSGIGISTDRLSEVFEPFHQLDSSMTRHFPGTGLGLALVKKIMDAHDTQIKVSSIVGEGSEFSFVLRCNSHKGG